MLALLLSSSRDGPVAAAAASSTDGTGGGGGASATGASAVDSAAIAAVASSAVVAVLPVEPAGEVAAAAAGAAGVGGGASGGHLHPRNSAMVASPGATLVPPGPEKSCPAPKASTAACMAGEPMLSGSPKLRLSITMRLGSVSSLWQPASSSSCDRRAVHGVRGCGGVCAGTWRPAPG